VLRIPGRLTWWLWDFLPRFNQRFAVPAREPGLAYRPVPDGGNPDEAFCFKYECTVGKDNVVRFGWHRLQIMPTNGRLSYGRANAEVHERMDGSLAVYYKGQCLLARSAPPEAPVLRVRNTARFIRGASDSWETVPAYQLRPQRQRFIVLISLPRIIRGAVLSQCVSIGGNKIEKQLG